MRKGLLDKGFKIAKLKGLAAELQAYRSYPSIVSKGEGRYEGQILGFVKGLKLSAEIIYYLRDQLSGFKDYEINWGHLVDSVGGSCSPECDIIIHKKGSICWNGHAKPIMHFHFVKADHAKIIISCKSKIDQIDKIYPESLKKYGVNHIFLLAECCKATRYKSLNTKATNAGYVGGLYYLYLLEDNNEFKTDDKMYVKFIDKIRTLLEKEK